MSSPRAVGGKLRLKGGLPANFKKRKRENREASSSNKKAVSNESSYGDAEHSYGDNIRGDASRDVYSHVDAVQSSGKTAAQLAFERQARRTEKDTMSGAAALPYRQRIDEYNKRLASLSEHHDIPKVGPG